MNKLIAGALYFSCFLNNSLCSGQEGDVDQIYHKRQFESISVDDGLSNNLITAIVQDTYGYLWVGTADGLCRYGGNEFVTYRNTTSQENSLLNNQIHDLLYDSVGARLLIATDFGLEIFDQAHTSFSQVTSVEGNIIQSSCRRIVRDEEGRFYALYADRVLSFTETDTATIYLEGQLNVGYNDIIISSDQFLASRSDGIIELYQLPTGSLKHKFPLGSLLSLNFFSKVNSEIVIATVAGLYVFRNDRFEKLKHASLDGRDLIRVYQDRRGFLWIGTRQNGLLISEKPVVDLNDPTISFEILEPAYDGSSVFGKTIKVITEDDSDGVWLGSWSSGLNYTKYKVPNVHLIRHNPLKPNSISHNRVWGLTYGGNGELWIGTDGGGVNRYNFQTGENSIYRAYEAVNSISGDEVLCALRDAKGYVWFGTYNDGLSRFDPKTERFISFNADDDSPYPLANNDVRLLYEDTENQLWVGTNYGGLQRWDPTLYGFLAIPYFEGTDVRSMVEDNKGGFWIATYSTWFAYYHPKKNIFHKFDESIIPDLANNRISSLLLQDDYLWIGTRSTGLLKLNLQDSSYFRYDEGVGLINSSVRAVINDHDGDIWISTNRGISCLNTETGKIRNYDKAYGIQSGEFNVGSVLKLSDKYLCFGGTKGLNILDTEGLKKQGDETKIVVSQIHLYDRAISEFNKNVSPLFSDFYELAHDQNTLRIQFDVLNLPKASNELFYYRLLGNDEQWQIGKGSNTVTYANLRPNTYVLEVSRNSNDLDANSVKKLTIVIKPAIWRSKLAIIFYILTFILIVWIVLRYYTRQVKLKSSLDSEKKIREEEKKLNQERIRFFTNFSHELRTPLTLIIGPLKKSISEAKSQLVKEKLELIYRNALKLNNLINKLLDFRRAQSDQMTLKFSRVDLPVLLKKILESYRDHTKIRGIDLYMGACPADAWIWVDVEKIEIIMNNLISNALKYTDRGGWVEVSMGRRDKYVVVSVSDNGIGIPAESLESIFQWYYQVGESKDVSGTGIGLPLTQKLVELHGGEISVTSNREEGSIFTFTIEDIEPGEDEKSLDEEHLKIEIPVSADLYSVFPPEIDSIEGENSSKSRILVVDDNQDIVQYIKHVLSDTYIVFSAVDGEKGIELAKEELPDLIISDVMMPEKSGIDLCKSLKEDSRTSHIPIVLLTAKHSVEDTILGYAEGADSYMTKPFDEQVLLTRIENLLKARITLQEFFSQKEAQDKPQPSSTATDEIKITREMQFLAKAEKIILEHVSNGSSEIGVHAIAKELGFSRASLYRKLKTVSGYSINEFIRKIRLKKANELIVEGEMNISEAAFYVGFNDIKYFRSVFKKEFGVLPSDVKSEAPDKLL